MIPATLAGLAVPIDSVELYHANPREGDVEVIKESLTKTGQYRPIVVWKQTNEVLAGNHTLKAARALGWTEIAATFVDCDEETAKRIVLVDNRAADLGGYNDEVLAELLQGLDTLEGSGFQAADLDALLADLGPNGWGSSQKDAAPPLPETAITQPGDVIELGPHRLVCGSSLDSAVVAMACKYAPADLVLTDPPYTVSYEENMTPIQASRRRKDGKKVSGDTLTGEAADEFVNAAFVSIYETLRPGGVYYCFAPPGPDIVRFINAGVDADLAVKQLILWVKDRFTFGRQDYHWRHEAMLYGWRGGAGHFFVGDYTQDTLWECDRPKASKDHPTMKPVALLERAINNSSRKGELVFDGFAGSGSTLVAAMSLGRRCALVELDPLYCDVIVNRYEKLTQQEAKRP